MLRTNVYARTLGAISIMKIKLFSTIIILVIGIALFTYLLNVRLISDTVYATLLGLTVLSSVALPNIERLKELDIKNLRAVLSEIKKESHLVKVLSGDIAELIALNGLFEGRWGDEKTIKLREQINEKQIARALSALDSNAPTDRIQRYRRIFQDIDTIGSVKNDDPAKDTKQKRLAELNQELEKTLEKHLESLSDQNGA